MLMVFSLTYSLTDSQPKHRNGLRAYGCEPIEHAKPAQARIEVLDGNAFEAAHPHPQPAGKGVGVLHMRRPLERGMGKLLTRRVIRCCLMAFS